MTPTFRLGRIAGIQVGANWSVLVILALIVIGLAAGRLPLVAPGRSVLTYAAVGALSGLAFLASLLAHEVSHAVVARRNGIAVEGITLWLFGGVAQLRGEASSPGADLRIALIPAAPLDGGRILRAALWRVTGDRRRVAVIATRAGVMVGFVLIGLGLAQVVLGRGFGGLWLALIGWFLVNAARAEEQQTVWQFALDGIQVADVMTPDPVTASPELTVQQFIDGYLMQHRFSTVAASQEPLVDLLPRMAGCSDGRAVVLDPQRRPVGIVSPSDVARTVQTAELRMPVGKAA